MSEWSAAESERRTHEEGFTGGFNLTHTVHLVASHGAWKWILPSWRFRDYKADRCPTDGGSSPPPSQS